MKLLVSCPRKLLLVDSCSADVQLVEADRPEYYGISWSEDGRSLCLGHSGVENASLGTLQSYMDSELGWISYGAAQGPPTLSATHQILCVGDRVITTNTGRNCVTVFRTDDWFYRNYWIDDIRWDRKGREDSCGSHFNSLFLRDGLLYVIAHNHNRGSNVVRLSWPEMEVVGIDKTTTLMAHNVWPADNGELLVCDSMRGTLVDVASNRVVWRCDVPQVVTRGLASNGEYVFVGHSAIGTRETRVSRDSRIWVIDRATWKTVDSLLLPGSGNVHEIRILDEPDLCHHGQTYGGSLVTLGPLHEHLVDTEEPAILSSIRSDDSLAGNGWEQHVAFAELGERHGVANDFSLATSSRKTHDVVVQAHVDIRSRSARHIGLVARYQGPGDSNMVVALLAKAETAFRVQLWRQHQGEWSCLKTAKVRRGEGTLELKMIGQNARVTFDGAKLFELHIADVPSSGRVGVRSARGRFADLKVQYLEATDSQSTRRAA